MKYVVINKWVDNSYNESKNSNVFDNYKDARKYVADEMKLTKEWAINEGWDDECIEKYCNEKTKEYCVSCEKWEDHYWIEKYGGK